jgi:hypothetical protein
MSNVLSEEKRQQVIALGRLGWSLRRIEQATGVRRETGSAYLKAAGIAVRAPGAWGRRPAKPANEVTTGSQPVLAAQNCNIKPENLPKKGKSNNQDSKPAKQVTTGFGVGLRGTQPENPKLTPSACEPFREFIELGLSRGRNAMAIWQDLLAETGFRDGYGTVKRFVRKLRGHRPLEARAVIVTDPGEEAQVDYGTGPMVRDPQSGKYRRTRLVEVEAAYYGLPPGWIGHVVQVRWDELFVRILDPKSGQLLREHVRQKRGGYRFREEDASLRRPFKVSQLLWRAEHAGTQIGVLCNHIYTQQGQLGIRRIQGVLSLAKKYGTAATEDACAVALEMGVREYQFVRRYLERTPQLSLRQIDPLIRELVHYRDLINQKTQEPTS